MDRHFHLPAKALLLISIAGALSFSFLLFNKRQPILAAVPAEIQRDFSPAEAATIARTNVDADLLDYLVNNFCAGGLCRSGSWTEWVILNTQSSWEIADLQLLHTALLVTMRALDDAGFGGYSLLSGYRFRHSRGVYLPGELGILARVDHEKQEVVLADGALRKQWGFYIYHELGHIVDKRLAQLLTYEFQRLAHGDKDVGDGKTADGFWLNKAARERPAEATADAFALWIVLNHTTNPRPVIWLRPEGTNYETIAGVMDSVIQGISPRRT